MRRTKTIAVAILVCSVSSATAQKMYWPDASANKIQRANIDGTGVEDLVTGLLGPVAIALDLGEGKMYWIDYQTIQRADLAGSNVETLITGLGDLRGLALDTQGGKMYWLGEASDKVQRANLDGTNIEDLVDMGTLYDAGEIVLDVCAGKMYWSESEPVVAKIQRANMEIPEGELPNSRSDVEDVLTFMDGLEEPWGLAVDGPSQKIYWTDNGTNKIQRANLDGSDIEDLVTTGLDVPRGMTLDLESAKMYWADAGTDKIQRANLDGSNIEDVVSTGLASPFDVVLDVPEECAVCGDGDCGALEDICSCEADCGMPSAQEEVGLTCDDGIDNDCDTLVDCDDPDCVDDPFCIPPFCGDDTCDENEDLCSCEADCGKPSGQEEVGLTCDDEIDNDCDTLIDCDDPDCDTDPFCILPPIPGGPGDLLVTTARGNDWVERFDGVTGQFLHKFTTGPTLVHASGITIGPDGLLYVSGTSSRNVVRFNLFNGELLDEFVESEAGGLDAPWSITFGPDGHLYACEHDPAGVRRYDGTTGEYIDEFVSTSGDHLWLATDLKFGPDGNLYIISSGDHRVVRFDGMTGEYIDDFIPAFTGGLVAPGGMIFSDDGYLYVSSQATEGAVYRFDAATGEFVDVFVEQQAGDLNSPEGLAFGPDGDLYVSSTTNNVVLRFDGETGEFIGGVVYGPFIANIRYMIFQPPECSTDADCDDGDADTTDSCYTWRCTHSPFSRLYVDGDATGSESGLSWTDAFTDLQDALDTAATGDGPIEVWVAEGTYKPDRGTQDREAAFQLLDGVSLYGGFVGTETALDERDLYANTTILSGDLAGDDEEDFTNYEENSYHVVIGSGSGVDAPSLIDGFLITAGNANGPDFKGTIDRGGGMLTLGGSPRVVSCTFSANRATLGGGMHNESYSRTFVESCGFFGNLADTNGGGMVNHSNADSIITNSVFSGNTADNGGAMYLANNSRPTLTNCTVTVNTATTAGGGLYGIGSYTTLTNSILWFNSDSTGNGESAQFGGSTNWTIDYCCIMGWTGDFGGIENTGDCNPEFQDPNGDDNIIGTPDDDFRLSATSLCVDVGDNDADSDAIIDGLQPIPDTDADGNARIYNEVIDKGAYEFFETVCEGDANGDGTVDPLDSGYVLARFGCEVGSGDTSCAAADQNGDGNVDPLDSSFVLARFGDCS